MKLQIAQFRAVKSDLLKNVQENGIASLALFCACYSLPVAAAAVFVIEEMPELKEEMEQKLSSLKEFYGYEIIEE